MPALPACQRDQLVPVIAMPEDLAHVLALAPPIGGSLVNQMTRY